MAIPINTGIKEGGGGNGILGAIGSAIGLIGGAVLAPFTGGTSLIAGAAVGSGIGKTVGSLADSVIDPAKADKPQGIPQGDSAMSRKAASVTSGDQNKILAESVQALSSPEIPPDLKQAAAPILSNAMSRRAKAIGTGVIS